MYIFLTVIHVIISVALVLIILAQSSKGGALDGLVGGTASNMFGSHGASEFLSKWTKILGAAWLLTSLILAMNIRILTAPRRSAIDQIRRTSETQPARAQEAIPEMDVLPGEESPAPQEVDSQDQIIPDETIVVPVETETAE